MADLKSSNWQETLSKVEHSIDQCLTALDRYESAFQRILIQDERVPEINSRTSPNEHAWEEKLDTAQQQIDEVESLLEEQQHVWSRWRQVFDRWQQLHNELPVSMNHRTKNRATAKTAS